MNDLPLLVFNHGLNFQDSVCNGCHHLTTLCLNISDIAKCLLSLYYSLANLRAIKNFLENFVLENCGYIQKNIVLIFTQGRFFFTFFAYIK